MTVEPVIDHPPSSEEVRKAIEKARQLSQQPFRLTQEERNEFKRDILSAIGRDRAAK